MRGFWRILALGLSLCGQVWAQEVPPADQQRPRAQGDVTPGPTVEATPGQGDVTPAPTVEATPVHGDVTPAPTVEATPVQGDGTPAPTVEATPAQGPAGGEPKVVAPAADIGGAPKVTAATTGSPTRTVRIIRTPTLDYAAWEAVAARAEEAVADDGTTPEALEALRVEVVDWRERLLAGQNVNATRIGTVRTQIAALGPEPAEGATEPAETAAQRTTLGEQLTTLQAPVLAAEAAHARANALVGEIDRALRDRQADELLKLWPMPVNPANWPAALGALRDTAMTLYEETMRAVRWPSNRVTFANNLPAIALYLALALGLLWRGRDWIDRLVMRLQARAAARVQRLGEMLASLGQVLVPMLGVVALSRALDLSGMVGLLGRDVVAALPALAAPIFVAIWLGGRLFPHEDRAESVLLMAPERRAEARVLASSFGVLLALEGFRSIALSRLGSSEAAVSVLSFPILAVGGFLLLRMGRLLKRYTSTEGTEAAPTYRLRVLGLIGQGAMVIGLLAPFLAAVGYVSAAGALVYPAILTLGVIGALFLLQQLVQDAYSAILGDDEAGAKALIPVLVGFALTLGMLPVLALIWGARVSDLTELWTRFREGFQLGATRISPTDFLVFAAVFAIGYMLTKLFQGALKSTILPKTNLDRGGQNAISVGVGYLGIFIAALIAINAAGLDLSGLAIVAGALSVGIGFGLQTIVSNFVSGIILLIERPVSEGDWIEVGTVQGIVKAISVRSTRIQTFDRNDVIVPNSDLITGRVTNWTRFNLSGRLIVPVSVAFMSDARQVEKILREIAEAQPMAILNPAPLIVFMGYGPETMNFEIRVILRDVNALVPVRSDINHAIAERFAEAGIDFSLAHRDLRLKLAEEAQLRSAETALPPVSQLRKDAPA